MITCRVSFATCVSSHQLRSATLPCPYWQCGGNRTEGGRELAPHPETAAQTMGGANLLRQAYEYWPCVDFAMAQSHGTREFIGGGELAPRPETAAQTRHG